MLYILFACVLLFIFVKIHTVENYLVALFLLTQTAAKFKKRLHLVRVPHCSLGHCNFKRTLVLIFTHTWKKSLFSKNFRTRFGNVSYRFVRILALKQGQDTSVKYFCHFQDGKVVIEANYHEIWVSAWHPHPPKGNLLEGFDNKTIRISICLHTLGTEMFCLGSLLMLQRAGMRDAGKPLPLAF